MKTIFTYKGRRYGYKLVDGHVKTYELMGTHNDETDAETTYNKLTDEEWEYIINELSDNEQGV